uniref:TM2 domain-containing protein n=1 Tax=Parascaris univalens TaxID=6257 RepID=A0A915B1J8_PARUN
MVQGSGSIRCMPARADAKHLRCCKLLSFEALLNAYSLYRISLGSSSFVLNGVNVFLH